jgi:hypothetical protein
MLLYNKLEDVAQDYAGRCGSIIRLKMWLQNKLEDVAQ